MQVQEEERRRLSLDLHDDPLQRAVLLARQVAATPGRAALADWRTSLEEIVVSLRAICAGLRPASLDDLGLMSGLGRLVADARARSDMTVYLVVEPDDLATQRRLAPDLEVALYRVAQEALNNCLKHSHATQVTVTLLETSNETELTVTDNGHGYDRPADDVVSQTTDQVPSDVHLGIIGMRERLRAWDGDVTIASDPGRGTTVRAKIPYGVTHD